ncbi:MAG: N-glycosylase/DNA lyase [Candidatus Woesearchaeota archaeon]
MAHNNTGELESAYRRRKKEIKERLREFSRLPESEWFYELCFCLCTPQSNAKKCDSAVKELKEKDFRRRNVRPGSTLMGNVRFHNNKARYLIRAKNGFAVIKAKIREYKDGRKKDPKELREWLVDNVKGMGMKEASHFLRNTGFRGLAILDRHILKNMKEYGGVSAVPDTLTKKEYLRLEKQLRSFSEKIGIDMDELDLLFWSLETGEVFK